MIHAAILDDSDNLSYWENISDNNIQFSPFSEISEITSCDIIIVAYDYAGDKSSVVFKAVNRVPEICRTPVAAVTNNSNGDFHAKLLDLGFDDVWALPIHNRIMQKRIEGLVAAFSRKQLSFDSLISITDDGRQGAYCVPSCDFSNIYKFVLRMLQRVNKNAQILLMTLSSTEDISEKTRIEVMKTLSNAVTLCLRRGDILSICGENQIIVLLIGANDEGGHLVASRIVSSFYSCCSDRSFNLEYDIKEVISNQ